MKIWGGSRKLDKRKCRMRCPKRLCMDQTEHFPKWSRWEHQGPRISRTRWKEKAQKSPPLFVLDGCPPRPTSFQNRDLLAHRQGEARVFSDSFCIISIAVKAQGCPGQERGVYEKSYKEKIHLKRRKTLHFWRKPFKSRRCFLQTWELTRHQRTHTGPNDHTVMRQIKKKVLHTIQSLFTVCRPRPWEGTLHYQQAA
ncbi:uncharacterized protein LOC127045923 [Gopherus flavomarginatus]|uniref:uncharacterized protein LOC127045923 n=1 Tax=Gopherus flavomarginatus TaxID=286002 RepID=UPI0021CB9F1D|nr:uncharacterized protein LOC127045923 [Gopherus flavomarginatus]